MGFVALAVSVVSLLLSGLALRLANRPPAEPRTSVLRRVCAVAVGYAEKTGGSNEDKLRHAIDAARLLDQEDGKRDFSDSELRVGVEAALTSAE
jgi:hypothetical protein